MEWFCWRLPKKSSISLFFSLSLSLSLAYKNTKAQLKIEAKQSFYLFSSLMRTGLCRAREIMKASWNGMCWVLARDLGICAEASAIYPWFASIVTFSVGLKKSLATSFSNLVMDGVSCHVLQSPPCDAPRLRQHRPEGMRSQERCCHEYPWPKCQCSCGAGLWDDSWFNIFKILISIVQFLPGKLTWKMRMVWLQNLGFPSKSSANSGLHPAGWLSVLATTSMAPVVSSWSTARSLSTVSAQWRGRCISWLWVLAWRVLPMIPTSRQRRSRCTTSLVDIRWLVFHFGKELCCKVEPLVDSLLGLLSKSWETEIGLQWYVTSSYNLTQKKRSRIHAMCVCICVFILIWLYNILSLLMYHKV